MSMFRHFDAKHSENFCSAVLLTAIENDDGCRHAFVRTVAAASGLSAVDDVVEWGREGRFQSATDQDRRTDIWLRLRGPLALQRLVIEVKTRAWDAAKVVEQLREHDDATTLRGGEKVMGVILLAPARLCHEVKVRAASARVCEWPALLRALREAATSSVTLECLKHLEKTLGTQPGFLPSEVLPFREVMRNVGCLYGFLGTTITALGGTPRKGLNLSRHDGQSYVTDDGWRYFGMSVPFEMRGSREWVLGLYCYEADSTGGPAWYRERPKMELYNAKSFICHVDFDAEDLSPDSLLRQTREMTLAFQKTLPATVD